jgi:hypothetical protein
MTMRKRTTTFGVSMCLHIVVLAVLIVRSRGEPELASPRIEVESVSAAEIVAADQQLPVSNAEPVDDRFEASLVTGEFAFDLAKIRRRENALFPFLTLDLMFLDRVAEDLDAARQRLTNPLSASQGDGRTPPLEMSDMVLRRTIDRAWSRRERWKTFREVAALVSSHDASRGRAPELVRRYLDQNILQPYCDGDRHDPRFWAMLENAADHADFVDFVRSYARQRPSSKTTTELLFLLDELAQGSREVVLMLIETKPDQDLSYTKTMAPEAFQLANAIKERYARWFFDRGIDKRTLRRHYDELRLRLLKTIIETTPSAYRSSDARFLAGHVLFEMNRAADAEQMWRLMTPSTGDAYYQAATEILSALRSGRSDARSLRLILGNEYGRWRLFSIDRLREFGHHCDTF